MVFEGDRFLWQVGVVFEVDRFFFVRGHAEVQPERKSSVRIQYATPLKNLLFWAMLELLCKAG